MPAVKELLNGLLIEKCQGEGLEQESEMRHYIEGQGFKLMADSRPAIKILGRRKPSRGGLQAAAPFLEMVIRLRAGKPFIPKGVHRFKSFEESEAWSMKMIARPPNPDQRV